MYHILPVSTRKSTDCMLFIYHTRKSAADDELDCLSAAATLRYITLKARKGYCLRS